MEYHKISLFPENAEVHTCVRARTPAKTYQKNIIIYNLSCIRLNIGEWTFLVINYHSMGTIKNKYRVCRVITLTDKQKSKQSKQQTTRRHLGEVYRGIVWGWTGSWTMAYLSGLSDSSKVLTTSTYKMLAFFIVKVRMAKF